MIVPYFAPSSECDRQYNLAFFPVEFCFLGAMAFVIIKKQDQEDLV